MPAKLRNFALYFLKQKVSVEYEATKDHQVNNE